MDLSGHQRHIVYNRGRHRAISYLTIGLSVLAAVLADAVGTGKAVPPKNRFTQS